MMLRVQHERMNASYFPNAREYSRRYGLDAARMAALPDHAIVMHPGPMNRGMEIAADVADSVRSVIVEQVANGVSVRMAVLYLLLGGSESAIGADRPAPVSASDTTGWQLPADTPLVAPAEASASVPDNGMRRRRGDFVGAKSGEAR
jgi:hypothetical protein